jgi:hypothetical protein
MPKAAGDTVGQAGDQVRIKHLRGEENLATASLQDFWDED